jgi:hypothetical protein
MSDFFENLGGKTVFKTTSTELPEEGIDHLLNNKDFFPSINPEAFEEIKDSILS